MRLSDKRWWKSNESCSETSNLGGMCHFFWLYVLWKHPKLKFEVLKFFLEEIIQWFFKSEQTKYFSNCKIGSHEKLAEALFHPISLKLGPMVALWPMFVHDPKIVLGIVLNRFRSYYTNFQNSRLQLAGNPVDNNFHFW